MNWELIKHKFCRLVVTASLLLGGVMVSAAASGTMPLWLRCWGFLLRLSCSTQSAASCWAPRSGAAQGRTCRTSRPAVQLCVVRGGHAA